MPRDLHPLGCRCARCPGARPHPADTLFPARALVARVVTTLFHLLNR